MHPNNMLVSLLGLAASASAHVYMSSPKGWPVNNSPLKEDGSDFPCKGVDYDSSIPTNVFNKGDSVTMSFVGSAVHGGGSCQVSLTTDLKPTKSSVWKVIKTFEGGCPAQGMDGNYGENAEFQIPFGYDFVIPDDVPAGKYTLAWTWFNRIGNREMYMNCVPAEAVGSGGSTSSFNALPDMFVANVGNGCKTEEGSDLEFPNPGKAVERLGNFGRKGPSGSCQESSGGGGGGDEDKPTTPQPGLGFEDSPAEDDSAPVVSTPASEPTPAPEAPEDTPNESEPTAAPEAPEDTPYEPEVPAESAPVESDEPEVPTESAPVESAPVESDEPAADTPADNGSAYAAGTPCQNDGYWNCVDGNSFQRCGSGIWSAVLNVASGTSCVPGESEVISMSKRGSTRFGAKFFV